MPKAKKTVEIEIKAKDSTGEGAKSAENSLESLKRKAQDFQKGLMAIVALDSVFGRMGSAVQKVANVAKSAVSGFQAFGLAGGIVTTALSAANAVGEAFIERAERARDAVLAWADAMRERLASMRQGAFDALASDLERVERASAAAAASFDRLAASRERANARREALFSAAGEASMLDLRAKASKAVFDADDEDRARVRAEWAVKIAEKEAAQKSLAADRAAKAEEERLKLLERRVRLEARAARDADASVAKAQEALRVARETAEASGKRGWEVDADSDVARYSRLLDAAKARADAASARAGGARDALADARQASESAALERRNSLAAAAEARLAAERNLDDILRREHLDALQKEEADRLDSLRLEERERLAAERRIARERESLSKAELQERLADERNAAALVIEAQARLNQAWNWYKDKDALAVQIKAEKEDAKAQIQFEKDFGRLRRFRKDWRNAENLSLDDEAVRRVAVAREQRDAAERYAAQTADAAQRAADALEHIQQSFQEGGTD
ncbi:MAG: hypothetical protein IKO43_03190 [Kiritimatiellae bacterium]|nr:hypothetical protein [Kiritimatiellia bacterium]